MLEILVCTQSSQFIQLQLNLGLIQYKDVGYDTSHVFSILSMSEELL